MDEGGFIFQDFGVAEIFDPEAVVLKTGRGGKMDETEKMLDIEKTIREQREVVRTLNQMIRTSKHTATPEVVDHLNHEGKKLEHLEQMLAAQQYKALEEQQRQQAQDQSQGLRQRWGNAFAKQAYQESKLTGIFNPAYAPNPNIYAPNPNIGTAGPMQAPLQWPTIQPPLPPPVSVAGTVTLGTVTHVRKHRVLVPCFIELTEEGGHDLKAVVRYHPRWLKQILSLNSVGADLEGGLNEVGAIVGHVYSIKFVEDQMVELDGLMIGNMEADDVKEYDEKKK